MSNDLMNIVFKRRGIDDAVWKNICDTSHSELDGIDDLTEKLNHLEEARSNGSITVLPDFDMDGIASGVCLYAGLSQLGFNANLYVPHPDRGYGFNEQDIDEIMSLYPDTVAIITCDTGISCKRGIKHAVKFYGVDVFVTDHHVENKSTSPRGIASAIVDPCAIGSTYEHKGICGAHVAWQVLMSYAMRYGDASDVGKIERLRVFAGIGTISDSMPMLYENRGIVSDLISDSRLLETNDSDYIADISSDACEEYMNAFRGLWGALRKSSKSVAPSSLWEDFFGFYVAPEFNSVKRMNGDMCMAFSVFMSGKPSKPMRYLVEMNDRRKAAIEENLAELLRSKNLGLQPYAPWCMVSNAKPGILGLLAQRLGTDRGPRLVVSKNGDGGYSGSGRSPEWLPFIDYAASVEGVHPAGHQAAFGVRVDDDNAMRRLCDKLSADVPLLRSEAEAGIVGYDICIGDYDACDSGYDVDALIDFAAAVDSYHPYGPGFEVPRVLALISADDCTFRRIGADGKHVKASVNGIDVLMWNQASLFEEYEDDWNISLPAGSVIGVVGNVSVNEYNGVFSPQISGDVVLEDDDCGDDRKMMLDALNLIQER